MLFSSGSEAQCYIPRRGGATYYRAPGFFYGTNAFGCYQPIWNRNSYLGDGLVVVGDDNHNDNNNDTRATRLKPGAYLVKINGRDEIVTIPDSEKSGFNVEELEPNKPYLMEFNGKPGIVVVRKYEEGKKQYFKVECTPLCPELTETLQDTTSTGAQYTEKAREAKKNSTKTNRKSKKNDERTRPSTKEDFIEYPDTTRTLHDSGAVHEKTQAPPDTAMLHRYFNEDFDERMKERSATQDTLTAKLKRKWLWLLLGRKIADEYRGEDMSDPEERETFFDDFYKMHTKDE
jgi:hypothetical protein